MLDTTVKHAGREADGTDPMPSALAALSADRIVDLDVRQELRDGGEPFQRIMAARQALPEGCVLRLRAIFEPVPLYRVMGRYGFRHWTEELAEDDWRVWFYRAQEDDPAEPAPTAAAGAASEGGGGAAEPGAGADGADDEVVVLDVRGLEPPDPLVRTLEALERLPAGKTLVQLNVRVPQFLLPRLEERGFTYEIRESSPDLVRVFIRHRADA